MIGLAGRQGVISVLVACRVSGETNCSDGVEVDLFGSCGGETMRWTPLVLHCGDEVCIRVVPHAAPSPPDEISQSQPAYDRQKRYEYFLKLKSEFESGVV